MGEEKYSTGHDPKSLILNLASLLLFLLPFVAYFYNEYVKEYGAVVVSSFVLALLVPPFGWRRPHPYSDDPTNLPMGKKAI